MRGNRLRLGALGAASALPLLAFLALALAKPGGAEAHPLGNFTVNRYSRIELYSDAIRIRYVLDMAEIPTFQEIDVIDLNGDGEPGSEESKAYLSTKSKELRDGLSLTINGSHEDLRIVANDVSYPEGQGGLRTLRLTLLLEAPTGNAQASVEYRDDNYADRIGWKEIVVRAGDGVILANSTVSSEDVSRELTAYPGDLLASPLDFTSAKLAYSPGSGVQAPAIAEALVSTPEKAPARAASGFAGLVDRDNLTLPVMLLSLLLAFTFGAIHALEPGHGKTFVAAYFVGVKGTVQQALSLGAIITTTHTIGVLAIGIVVLFGSRFILPEHLYPWLSLASALMILGLGLRLAVTVATGAASVRRLVAMIRRQPKSVHAEAQNVHGHTHSHDPCSSDGTPPWRSLIAIGLADGLTPSPSALVVLLAAVSLDRIVLGILLIFAFSVGLGAVLALVCLSLIYARRFLDWLAGKRAAFDGSARLGWIATQLRLEDGLLRAAPVGGAFALLAIGLVLTVRALSHNDLIF